MGTVKWLGLACVTISLTGCLDDSSGGSSGYQPPPAPSVATVGTQTGYFVDSRVQNADYRTDSHQGVTGADGRFQYELGETVTFSLGDMVLGSAAGQTVVTPLELTATAVTAEELAKVVADLTSEQLTEQRAAINMARLLQTLDKDGDASNGLVVTNLAKNGAAMGQDFDLDFATFETQVSTLIQNGGQDAAVTGLVDTDAAKQHLADTLACPGDRIYQVNGYGVTITRNLEKDSEALALDAISGTMTVGAPRDVAPTVRNELRDCDFYVGDDFRFNREACEVVDGEPRNLSSTDVRMVGTVTPNSATVYIYDGKLSDDHDSMSLADLDDGETAYDIPHGYMTAAAESPCPAMPVPAGIYSLNGVLSTFEVPAGWESEEISGDLVLSESSCSIRSDAGSWDCQVSGNRLFGLGAAKAIRGTINQNTVTLAIPYSQSGSDYRFGYLHGERETTP